MPKRKNTVKESGFFDEETRSRKRRATGRDLPQDPTPPTSTSRSSPLDPSGLRQPSLSTQDSSSKKPRRYRSSRKRKSLPQRKRDWIDMKRKRSLGLVWEGRAKRMAREQSRDVARAFRKLRIAETRLKSENGGSTSRDYKDYDDGFGDGDESWDEWELGEGETRGQSWKEHDHEAKLARWKRREDAIALGEDVSDISSMPSDGELSDLSECEEELEKEFGGY